MLDFGNAGEGDWSDIIQKSIDTVDTVHIPAGRFRIDKQINCPFNKTLICDGIVTFDGTVAFDGSSGLSVLNVGDISQENLPKLAGNLSKGDTKLIFQQPHGRNIGDIICLYNSLPYSWSSSREYYKAGEFCKIARIDNDTELTLDTGLFDDYQTSEVDVYYKTMGYFNVVGCLEIILASDGSKRPFRSITLNQIKDSVLQIKAVATKKAYARKYCYPKGKSA